jgi:hypothetical protein
MKGRNLFLFMLCMWTLVHVHAASNLEKSITLAAGEEKIIKIPNLKGISNPDDIIEDVVLNDGESVILRAVSWGNTQILAWDSDGKQITYKVTVKVPKYVTELEGFLQALEGVKVSFLGKNIIVEGQLLRESDINRLEGILNTFPQVKNMVVKDMPSREKIMLDAARAEIDNRTLEAENLGSQGSIIEGTSLSKKAREQANHTIAFYFDDVYPTINVKAPQCSLELGWIQFKGQAGKATPFASFMAAAQKQKPRDIWPYTFFKALSHSSVLSEIKKSGSTDILGSKKLTVKSGSPVRWQGEGARSLYIQCTPLVVDDAWMDCELELGLQENGAILTRYSKRIVCKRGQGLALAGLLQEFTESLKPDVLGRLQSDAKLGSVFQKELAADLLLVVTPNWSLRN